MRYRTAAWVLIAMAVAATAACGGQRRGVDAASEVLAAEGPKEVNGLETASTFVALTDDIARAKALFAEAGKVIQHPRCTNCHPSGESPTQGDEMRAHEPPVVRGDDGHGVVGMRCQTCHMVANVDLVDRTVPGSPTWHLAPASMGWVGRSLGEICEQLKDPARNGGMDLAAIAAHARADPLVGWAWDPGAGRSAPPGDQATFGGLIEAWVAAGAHCP